MSQKMRIGGSLETTLTQGYRLDLIDLLKTGWQQTRQMGFGLMLAIIGVGAIWFLLSTVLLTPYLEDESASTMLLMLSLLVNIMMSPLMASLDMLGLQQAIGIRAKPSQVFDFFKHFIRLAVLSFIASGLINMFAPLVVLLGLHPWLAAIPASLVSMMLVFTVPLAIERGLSPAQATLFSIKLALRGFNSIVLFHLALSLIVIVGTVLTFGVGLFWLLPFYFNCKGLLYRDLCGVTVEVSESAEKPEQDKINDHFNA